MKAPQWISVAAGRDHSIAVAADGTVYACGVNENGQLGLPGIENASVFSKVHSCENTAVQKVFAGGDHSFILLDHNFNREKEEDVAVPDDHVNVDGEDLLEEINIDETIEEQR